MRHVVTAALIVVGIIHLLPLSGVLGADRLQALYGIAVDEPNIAILMRHRAVLFGLLGGFFVLAAFVPSMQPSALVLGFISVVSFLLLAWMTGGYNANVARVVMADVVALVALVVGVVGYLSKSYRG
jgi:hypothetical protein